MNAKFLLAALISLVSLQSFADWKLDTNVTGSQSWLRDDEVFMRASLSPDKKKTAFLVYTTPSTWKMVKGRLLVVDTATMKIEQEFLLPEFLGEFDTAQYSDSRQDEIKCYVNKPYAGMPIVETEISWHDSSEYLIAQNQLIDLKNKTILTLNPNTELCSTYSSYSAKFQPNGNLILTGQANKDPLFTDMYIFDLDYNLKASHKIRSWNWSFDWIDENSFSGNGFAPCDGMSIDGQEVKVDCLKQMVISGKSIFFGNGEMLSVVSAYKNYLILQDDGYTYGGGFKRRYLCEMNPDVSPGWYDTCKTLTQLPGVRHSFTPDGIIMDSSYGKIIFTNPKSLDILYEFETPETDRKLFDQTNFFDDRTIFQSSQNSARVLVN